MVMLDGVAGSNMSFVGRLFSGIISSSTIPQIVPYSADLLTELLHRRAANLISFSTPSL